MRYLPHTPEEIASMLETVGLSSLDALHDPIPERARFTKPLDMLPALDEASLMRHLEDMAGKNRAASMLSFLGAGAYDHHFPPPPISFCFAASFTRHTLRISPKSPKARCKSFTSFRRS